MRTRDPVCGMEIASNEAASTLEHAGKTYFFCSDHCLGTFRAEPDKYLTQPSAAIYTCPMHPEIERDLPGNCPICGMALALWRRLLGVPEAVASECGRLCHGDGAHGGGDRRRRAAHVGFAQAEKFGRSYQEYLTKVRRYF